MGGNLLDYQLVLAHTWFFPVLLVPALFISLNGLSWPCGVQVEGTWAPSLLQPCEPACTLLSVMGWCTQELRVGPVVRRAACSFVSLWLFSAPIFIYINTGDLDKLCQGHSAVSLSSC